MRTLVKTLLGSLLLIATVAGATASNAAAGTAYKLVSLSRYGGEPSIWASDQGVLYDTTPSGGTILFRSNNGGKSWVQTKTADKNSGDDSVATDQSGAVYETNLAGSQCTHPLEADVWKSTNEGQTWMYGNTSIPTGSKYSCTSSNPFGVDREWADAYIPKGKTTKNALVALAYHDFYGPSNIWANISTDGGKTYGPPIDIFAQGNPSEATLWAVANSSCSTVPIGARIAKTGKHKGRIYVSWLASDPSSLGTGCNLSQAQAFHNVFIAWSDNKGSTWNIQLAYDAGIGHDASSPFASMTLDNQGNPYIGLTVPGPPSTAPGSALTCSQESITGGLQSDPNCSYHMWVIWSKDGGQTWDGGGGMLAGTAAKAYEVDPSKKPQTDLYPALAAGKPGHVAVAWLQTHENEPSDPLGKFIPGGCAGPAAPNPPTFPPTCKWQLMAAQSANLTQKPGQESWKVQQLTTTPMHVGDICNLGIACGPTSNRHLLDFISETLDPTTGCVHVAYADDNKVNKLRVANQVSGPSIQGGTCKLRHAPVAPPPVVKKHHHHHHHHHKTQTHHHHHHHKVSQKPKYHHRGFTG